jgi:hypothetical protein
VIETRNVTRRAPNAPQVETEQTGTPVILEDSLVNAPEFIPGGPAPPIEEPYAPHSMCHVLCRGGDLVPQRMTNKVSVHSLSLLFTFRRGRFRRGNPRRLRVYKQCGFSFVGWGFKEAERTRHLMVARRSRNGSAEGANDWYKQSGLQDEESYAAAHGIGSSGRAGEVRSARLGSIEQLVLHILPTP